MAHKLRCLPACLLVSGLLTSGIVFAQNSSHGMGSTSLGESTQENFENPMVITPIIIGSLKGKTPASDYAMLAEHIYHGAFDNKARQPVVVTGPNGMTVGVDDTLQKRDAALLSAGWKQVKDSYFDDTGKGGTGLTFSAYQKNNLAGIKEVVFVLGGTTAGKDDLKDVATDFDILSPAGAPGQFEKAMAKTNEWMAKIKAADPTAHVNFTATGHSLGGGLAQYVSIEKGINAVTFNSAPIPALKPGWADENLQAAYKSKISVATKNGSILNISTNNDPLSQLMRYVFEEKPSESAVVTATNLVATSYVQLFGDIIASGLKSGALKPTTGAGRTSDDKEIPFDDLKSSNLNPDVNFFGLTIKNSAARQMQLALSDSILDVQEFKKVVLAQYGLTNAQHIPLAGDKLILDSGTGHSMAGLLDKNFSKLREINPFDQLFFSGVSDNPAKEEVVSQTFVVSPAQTKAGIESRAKDKLAREKEIKEKEVALAATAKPDGNVEEMIARLVKLETERDYLDYAEKAINGRTGGAQSVFDGMTSAEKSKIKYSAYKLYGLPTPTEADAIRLISEFYALNSNNRKELFDLDVGLTDKSTMPDTLARQNYNQEAIQNRINALKNGQGVVVDDVLAKELAGLKETYDENNSKLGNMVSSYLESNAATHQSLQAGLNTQQSTESPVQNVVTTQAINQAARETQVDFLGTFTHFTDTGNNDLLGLDAPALPVNGSSSILTIEGSGAGGVILSPNVTTGVHNHTASGRFAELNDLSTGNFQYVMWGDWNATVPNTPITVKTDGSVSTISHGYWVTGSSPVEPPRTGSATYSGPAIGDLRLNNQNHVRELVGSITLGVNFATDSISANINLNRVSTGALWANVSGTAQLNRGGEANYFSTPGDSLSAVPLYVEGDFRGPASSVNAPPEVGGGWNVSNGVNGTGIGVYRAKKQ